jgi:ribosomal protein L37AE/L43A
MRAHAAATSPLPECPHCGGRDVERLGGRLWFCDGCGKTFTAPDRPQAA